MLKGLQNLNEWLGQLIDLAKMLVVIGIIVGIAHAPLEMMVINTLIILFLFYGWKKGKA